MVDLTWFLSSNIKHFPKLFIFLWNRFQKCSCPVNFLLLFLNELAKILLLSLISKWVFLSLSVWLTIYLCSEYPYLLLYNFDFLKMYWDFVCSFLLLNSNKPEGWIHPQPCFSLCCAKTVSVRLKFSGGVVRPSKPPSPPPYEQLFLLPTPCFRKFLERSLNPIQARLFLPFKGPRGGL